MVRFRPLLGYATAFVLLIGFAVIATVFSQGFLREPFGSTLRDANRPTDGERALNHSGAQDVSEITKSESAFPEQAGVQAVPVAELEPRREEILRVLEQFPDSYEELVARFSKSDLPILYELLENREYRDDWNGIVIMIGFLGEGDDAAAVLRAFVERREVYKHAYEVSYLFAKAHALEYLGLVGGRVADETLSLAVTRSGAQELGAEWLHEEFPMSDSLGDFTVDMNYRAGLGLALSQEPRNWELLEKRFLESIEAAKPLVEKHKNIEEILYGLPIAEQDVFRLYVELAWAMATRDTIAEVGLDAFIPSIYDMNRLPQRFWEHLERRKVLHKSD